jgi:hypothetical protein
MFTRFCVNPACLKMRDLRVYYLFINSPANLYTNDFSIDKKNRVFHEMVSSVHEIALFTHEMIFGF